MVNIVLLGWSSEGGDKPIAVIKAIREAARLELKQAKEAYERTFDEPSRLTGLSEEHAKQLCSELEDLGFRAEIERPTAPDSQSD